jgi:hypothetical protein
LIGKLFKAFFAAILLLFGAAVVLIYSDSDTDGAEPDTDALRRQAQLDNLRALPYLASTKEKKDETLKNVVRHDKQLAYPGYNLYPSRYGPEVYLVDMEGKVAHEWTIPQDDDVRVAYAALYPNGDLLVINNYQDVVRIDLQGRVIWRTHISAHHDIAITSDDSAYIVVNHNHLVNGLVMQFPGIAHLNPDGKVKQQWSTFDQMDEVREKFDLSEVEVLFEQEQGNDVLDTARRFLDDIVRRLKGKRRPVFDPLHQNTVTVIPNNIAGEKDERFRENNLLTCYRNINQIAIFDPDKQKFVWTWGQGELEGPHSPIMLESGNILIYDNGIYRESSRIIELDPLTEEIVWEYVGTPEEPFYSETGGIAQRLPNGNTLITETTQGRVFEVTMQGKIVWEWYHPGLKNGRRSRVYRMVRYSEEQVSRFLQ